MYRLNDYARMVADSRRVDAYVRALEATVRPGHVVVDIGTGTGAFAVVACKLGARRVYAVETADAIEVAKEVASENGCADRITFLRGDVREIDLPERADVILSDLRGGLPFAPANLSVIAHAREHLLARGGIMIPTRDVLNAGIVEFAQLYERSVGPAEVGGATLTAMRQRLTNHLYRDRSRSIRSEALLAPGTTWKVLDYARVSCEPVQGDAHWTVAREGEGHGVVLWFDSILAGDVGLSTAPGLDGVYPQIFLPWSQPVRLAPGDRVAVQLWVLPEGEAWGWNTEISNVEGILRHRFKQSTFLGEVSRPQPRVHTPRAPGRAS